MKAFQNESLLFPSRLRTPADGIVFHPLTASTAIRTLRNPRYAGVYAYGRRTFRRSLEGKKTVVKREEGDWLACLPSAHPGYITWERYQDNLRLLKSNGHGYDAARASPPREGVALLQGRAICGRCGQYLRVRYRDARGKLESWYVCDRGVDARGEPSCQSLAGTPIDDAVGRLVVATMTPAAVELAIEIRKEIEARYSEADHLRSCAVERARNDADLAQRRFMMVDPGNRLVADTLEADWNEKLRVLQQVRDDRERARRKDEVVIDAALRDRLAAMTTDSQRLWSDSSTLNRERKRMLAYVIEDATLVKVPANGTTTIHVRFRGGRTETLSTENPKASWQIVKTTTEVVNLVDQLLDDHIYAEIAEILNARGLRPGGAARPGRQDARFTAKRVQYLAHAYHLRPRRDRLLARGLLTKRKLAQRLQIHEHTLKRWVEHGIIKAHAYNGHAWLYEEPSTPPSKHSSRWDRLVDRAAQTQAIKPRRSKSSCRSARGVV